MRRKAGRPKGTRDYGSDALEARYRELELSGRGPREVVSELEREFPGFMRAMPEPYRSVSRWLREDRSLDRSGPWRVWMSDPEDVRGVFEVIGQAVRLSRGRVRWVTAAEAHWITRIRRFGVTHNVGRRDEPLPAGEVWAHARRMVRAQLRGGDDYSEDLLLGIDLELFPRDAAADMAGMMAGQSVGEWIASAEEVRGSALGANAVPN